MPGPITHLAVLLTCHNRRTTTLRCLEHLGAQDTQVRCSVFLVDDGCTDGTAEAVREQHPDVVVIPGSGSLYWVGGMRLAYERAVESGCTHVLWLNDDDVLDPDAIETMVTVLAEMTAENDAIVVGSVRDPSSHATTYGGLRRAGRFRHLVLERVEPTDRPLPCDGFHGNVVLVPNAVREEIGNLDPAFTHAMADTDYGLRARARGFRIWVAPGHVGTCPGNLQRAAWEDPDLTMRARLRAVLGPKGRPFGEWLRVTRRHGGPLWFVHTVSPYVRATLGWRSRRTKLNG